MARNLLVLCMVAALLLVSIGWQVAHNRNPEAASVTTEANMRLAAIEANMHLAAIEANMMREMRKQLDSFSRRGVRIPD